MHVLHDKSVLDPATLREHQRDRQARQLETAVKQQERHVNGQIILRHETNNPDPRWDGLKEIKL